MANENNNTTIGTGYLSEYYSNSPASRDVDMQQTLEYKYVKAFPSVYSSNNGQIYSEPNVRWLTKQFTKKPFIIPHDGNPSKDMFKDIDYGNASSLNGTYTYGGLANIDGYIFSIANDIDNIYFDNRDDVYFGSNSSGLIITQIVQQTMAKINEYLTINNLANYIDSEYLVQDGLNAKYQELVDNPNLNRTEIGHEKIEVRYGLNDDSTFNYIHDLVQHNPSKYPAEWKDIESGSYDATYNVYLGYPTDAYKEKETVYGQKFYRPFIFFEDVFGFIYVFTNSSDAIDHNVNPYYSPNNSFCTHTYPSTFDNRVGMQDISTEIPAANITSNVIKKMIPLTNGEAKIKDITSIYNDNIYGDFYRRDDSGEITEENLSDVYNNFTAVTTSDIIQRYCSESGTDISTITSIPPTSVILPDVEYCVKVTGDAQKVLDMWCEKDRNTETGSTVIPIGIMNSAGRLTPYNIDVYDFGTALRGVYTTVEGYVTFMRRISAKLTNTSSSAYINNPNGNNFADDSRYTIDDLTNFYTTWANVFRTFELNGISIDLDEDLYNIGLTKSQFFAVFGITGNDSTPYNVVKFHHIYNTFIAPFINDYMQIAWTSLYDNTVTSFYYNYVPKKALHLYRNDAPTYIQDDKYWEATMPLIHTYNINGNVINQNYNYSVQGDIMTDMGRYDNFLSSTTTTNLITLPGINTQPDVPLLSYRTRISSVNISSCDDYIGYIKTCTDTTDEVNHRLDKYNNGIVTIPYIITNLSHNKITHIVDNNYLYCAWPTTASSYNPDDGTITKVNVEAGYIQNVTIDTITLLPRKYYTRNFAEYDDNTQTTYQWVKNVSPYTLSITTLLTQQRVQNSITETFIGLDGLSFKGYTQGWVTSVPMVFRLYKDGQNYLEGLEYSDNTTNGVVVDYKVPIELEENDLCFSLLWLNTVRGVGGWNIEGSGANRPENTNKLISSLETRNTTIFDMDKIYTYDISGNYISLREYIENSNYDVTYQIVEEVIEDLDLVGKTIPTGTEYEIDGKTFTANNHCEIFNSYTNNKAAGDYSHAEGFNNKAYGSVSHTEGTENKTYSPYTHIEGSDNTIYENADSAHVEGHNNIVGDVDGNSSPKYSHVGGYNSTVTSMGGFAHGNGVSVSGVNAAAFGTYTTASQSSSLVIGEYNIDHTTGTKYPFVIGNGVSNNPNDAFKIDNHGKIYVGDTTEGVDLSYAEGTINADLNFEIKNNTDIVRKYGDFITFAIQLYYTGNDTSINDGMVAAILPSGFRIDGNERLVNVFSSTDYTNKGVASINSSGFIKIYPTNNWENNTYYEICCTLNTKTFSS